MAKATLRLWHSLTQMLEKKDILLTHKSGTNINDISQLTLLSRAMIWPSVSLEAILTQRLHCPLKVGKSLYFNSSLVQKMLGGIYIMQKKFIVKQMKLKSHSHTQKSALFTVTKFSLYYKNSGKFIRKSLVTTPILKGYMVPDAQ